MKEFIKSLKFTLKFAKENKKELVLIVLFLIMVTIGELVVPLLSAKLIVALSNQAIVQLVWMGLTYTLVGVLIHFFNYGEIRTGNKLYKSMIEKISKSLGTQILKLKNECLDEKGTGAFIQRMSEDTGMIANSFNRIMENISYFIQVIGMFVSIFIINKMVFAYTLLITIINFYLEKKRIKKRNEIEKERRKASERQTSFVSELVRGARDIKMLNSENMFNKEMASRIEKHYNIWDRKQKTDFNYRLIIWNSIELLEYGTILMITYMLYKESIVPAMALVLYNYATSIERSFYTLSDLLNYIKEYNLSVDRVIEVMESDTYPKESFGTKHMEFCKGSIEFKDVHFSYKDKPVLKGTSFKINPNETVAIVGKTGAGKTTIFNLIGKLYDVTKGTILLDDIDIQELDKDSIRGNMTIIPQNPYIFNMTIRENLELVKEGLTEKEMKEACKAACLENFIKELPDEYDTLIGEGGVNLSGGQKQRLAIARALVQKTKVILLDEATSALDNETQASVQEAINNMKKDYTILIVAHRLSTIQNANRILYLEDGKIIAEGTHQELLKNCQSYKKLYESEIIE